MVSEKKSKKTQKKQIKTKDVENNVTNNDFFNLNDMKVSESNFKLFHNLSPFEIKNILIDMSSKNKNVYNAGRGNPNFFCSFVRDVFADLQKICLLFCTQVNTSKTEYSSYSPDLYFYPEDKNLEYKNKLIKLINDYYNCDIDQKKKQNLLDLNNNLLI